MNKYLLMNKGDLIEIGGRKATLLSKPAYRFNHRSGLFYADVQFDDGELRPSMMICLNNLEVIKSAKEETTQ